MRCGLWLFLRVCGLWGTCQNFEEEKKKRTTTTDVDDGSKMG